VRTALVCLVLAACGGHNREAREVSEGHQLFDAFNCSGCHAHGGGGMGPALMDSRWIYGSAPQTIFATIHDGRPNGMPAFGGRIPDDQIWKLVEYVRSMSRQVRFDVIPARDDHMHSSEVPEAP
jgi:cytochrome c oxidase cbb3-type subunit 3